MPITHICEQCGKHFKQKNHLSAHMKRKRPCKKDDTLIKLDETTVEDTLNPFVNIRTMEPVRIDGERNVVEEVVIKKERGQFYTTNYEYILDGFDIPYDDSIQCIIEPFTGKGDLVQWFLKKDTKYPVELYDIEPKYARTIQRDTLRNPPDYKDKFIITNPPYLARNKTSSKDIFDKYSVNDLYKCFILSICNQANCKGGIIIIPSGFFLSSRPLDIKCRNMFMTKFIINKVKYFEETVFDDTPTTIVVISFKKSEHTLTEQTIEWVRMPLNESSMFNVKKKFKWIIGGDIYDLPINNDIKISRYVSGKILNRGEQQTYITLCALDGGSMANRIRLYYKEGYVYPAKDCSRTYATLIINGRVLTSIQQKNICRIFNSFIENKREKTWSLFLPQFRESKEYARKRIPFTLAYNIIRHIITHNIDG